jgi:hypothetical protein
MKIKLMFLLLATVTVSFPASAQVTVTAKRVTYTRPKPTMDFKKTFTINYPIVKAETPALSKKIGRAISPLTVLRISIKDEMREYQWLEDADYEVKYNANGVLCVDLFMEGTAAYPTNVYRTVVVDTKTGTVAKPSAVFQNIPGLVAMIKKNQKEEIANAIVEIKKDTENQEPNPEELFKYADFKALNLDGFGVSADGVMFKYSYSFAHVIQALEPSGVFSYTWAQIKPYIKRGGLLARVAR